MLTKYELYKVLQDAISATMPTVIRTVIDVKDRIEDLPDLVSRSTVQERIEISNHQFRKYEKLGLLHPVNPEQTKTTLYHKSEILEIYIKERLWDQTVDPNPLTHQSKRTLSPLLNVG